MIQLPKKISAIAVVAAVLLMEQNANAFAPAATLVRSTVGLNAVSPDGQNAEGGNPLSSRREALFGIASAAALLVGTAAPKEAQAKYSDYARREKDWQERNEKGQVSYSNARELRAQLQEIAPMNTSNSKIFCPNGPSSNVSPLMENKCGDQLAMPSVYGRSNDVMGNSVPGFKEGYAWGPGSSSSMSTAVGGFPTYKENEWTVRQYGN